MAKRPVDVPSDEEDDEDQRSSQASSSKRQKTNGHGNGKGKQRATDQDEAEEDVEMKVEDEQDDELYEDRIRLEVEQDIDDDGDVRELGVVAQMGIITKVVLEQFMNHTYLSVDLGPQINFLTGPNGSGKSALLTAITVALGAKASVTGRGAGIKDFIQRGKDAGRVTVHLKNKGPEAYRHDEYGDEIIVERSLNRTGTASAYKIQSSKKGKKNLRTVSTKRDELDKIMDHMNIQIDNPINVLSQDAAKAFLAHSGEKEKYDFFLRGTQLAQLSEEYDLVSQNITTITSALANKKAAMGDMKERVKEAQKRVDSVQVGQVLEKKLLNVQAESAWSMVIRKEAERDNAQAELDAKSKKARKTHKELDRVTTEEGALKTELTALEEDVNALKDAMVPAQEELKTAADEFKAAKVDLRSNDADQREITGTIAALQTEISGYEAQIARETARLAVDNSAEKRDRQEEIDRLTDLVHKTEAQAPILQAKVNALRARREDLANQLDELNGKIENNDRLIAGTAGRKQQLESSRGGGPLAPYGQRMNELINAIGRSRWQGETPIGPLGVGVKLRDMKYQDVIHTQLGSLLSSFGVTTPADARQLRTIIRDLQGRVGLRFPGQPPGIIIYRPTPHLDISSGDLSLRGYTTLLSLLDIPSVHVRNLLVDRASAERTPVFATREEASDEVVKLGEGATTVSLHPLYKMTVKQGTVSANFSSAWKAPGLFVADHEAEIRAAAEEIAGLKRKKDELLAQRRALTDEDRQVNQETRAIIAELDVQSNDVTRHKSAISSLTEQNRDQDPPNIAAFYELITERTDEKRGLEAQLRDSEAAKAAKMAEAGPLAAKHAEIKNRLEADRAKVKELQDSVVDKAQKLVKVQSDVQHWTKQIDPAELAVAQVESDLRTLETELVEWTDSCIQIHPERIETHRSAAAIDGEIKGLDKSIKEAKKATGISFEDAMEQLERSAEAFRTAKKEIVDMNALNNNLTAALAVRGEKWHHFRRYIALRAKVLFSKNLAVRGFQGKLIFEHEYGKLRLQIQTDDTADGGTQGATKNPNQLSGGEKSFSTCALLLAFWDTVGCPIRCLDEFDVFMDAINRRQTLTMMIDTAKATDNTQFILISPQDTSSVITGPSVKIIQMWDPERYEKGAQAD